MTVDVLIFIDLLISIVFLLLNDFLGFFVAVNVVVVSVMFFRIKQDVWFNKVKNKK